MTPITQTRLHIMEKDGTVSQNGNCFQAAVASIMELPLDEVPNFIEYSDGEWFKIFCDFVWKKGFEYNNHYDVDTPPKGWSIGSGISPRARKDHRVTHAVICYDGELIFDVHPDRTGIFGPFIEFETITKRHE